MCALSPWAVHTPHRPVNGANGKITQMDRMRDRERERERERESMATGPNIYQCTGIYLIELPNDIIVFLFISFFLPPLALAANVPVGDTVCPHINASTSTANTSAAPPVKSDRNTPAGYPC